MSTLFGEPKTDILCFGAHPDDIEIGAGGSILNETSKGKSVVLCDLTEGELGSRGTVDGRYQESEHARSILGATKRINCALPDGAIDIQPQTQDKIVTIIRTYRPRTILYNGPIDRHPDHEQAHLLVRYAIFRSGLSKITSEGENGKLDPWRPMNHFSYLLSYENTPNFFVDISDSFHMKMQAIKAYRSQFYSSDAEFRNEPETYISQSGFLDMIESRARYFGERSGSRYAEAFMSVEPISISSFDSLTLS